MTRKTLLLASLALLILVAACATVPMTGRKQLALIPDEQMYAMSFEQYREVIATSELSREVWETALVRTVGMKIQQVVEAYMISEGYSAALDGYAWEFNLIESEQINAWCMPGGKVAFYSGIMPFCKDEAGVAVVMGHEIAHAIAEHGEERMSQELVTQMGGMALNEALSSQPEETRGLYMTAFAIGAQYGAVLPYSRLHESEADRMGLIFMAMAGYDPRLAPAFWERMSAIGGSKPPEIMSTHPSDATRLKNLREHMPEALAYYKP